jgi:23S rRNA (cytosine1962-C5)-methyltransferase
MSKEIRLISLLNEARAKRASMLRNNATEAYRLFDGEGDGQADLYIDVFGEAWLVQSTGAFPEELRAASGFKSLYFKRLEKENKAAPQLIVGEELPSFFEVSEMGSRFLISFAQGYSQGLFIDQRENRQLMSEGLRDRRMLNLFSYTCAFSVVAAQQGADTVSVDLSSPYLEWGKKNFEINGLDPAQHLFWKGSSFDYLRRAAKRGERFHAIVIDPPSFSRDAKGKSFRVEKDFLDLVEPALKILEPGGRLLFSTNLRKQPWEYFERAFKDLARRENIKVARRAMPEDFREDDYLKAFVFSK